MAGAFGMPVAEKLTRENFLLWRAQVLPAIRGAQLVGFLEGTIPTSPATIEVAKEDNIVSILANPAYATWIAQDQ